MINFNKTLDIGVKRQYNILIFRNNFEYQIGK